MKQAQITDRSWLPGWLEPNDPRAFAQRPFAWRGDALATDGRMLVRLAGAYGVRPLSQDLVPRNLAKVLELPDKNPWVETAVAAALLDWVGPAPDIRACDRCGGNGEHCCPVCNDDADDCDYCGGEDVVTCTKCDGSGRTGFRFDPGRFGPVALNRQYLAIALPRLLLPDDGRIAVSIGEPTGEDGANRVTRLSGPGWQLYLMPINPKYIKREIPEFTGWSA